MLVTESGIVTDNSPRQPENADAPMLVEPAVTTAFVMILYEAGNIEDMQKPPGIVTDIMSVQPKNALSPMLSIELSIVTDVRS